MFKVYRRWQLAEAERNSAMRDALSDPDTAYVLLTRTGKRTSLAPKNPFHNDSPA
jgi:hypothetical protein